MVTDDQGKHHWFKIDQYLFFVKKLKSLTDESPYLKMDYQKKKELIVKEIGTKKSKNILETQKRKNIDNQDIKNLEGFNQQVTDKIDALEESQKNKEIMLS